jgi:hypothetical protein
MKIINVKQGTPEWHETRYRKVGGTLSKGLFTKGDTLKLDLLGQFLEDFEEIDNYTSPAMERGHELEPYALKEAIKYTGHNFINAGWLQCEEISILGISPDGITADKKHAVEIKCPSSKKHIETILNGGIPLDHIHQCLHYFTVNPELESLTFASFRPENKIKPLYCATITRKTEINLGTKSKPVLMTVSNVVEVAKAKAIELENEIKESIKQLEF